MPPLKKWAYHLYKDPNMGYGDLGVRYYIVAYTEASAWGILESKSKVHNTTLRMQGFIVECNEFKQPDPIPIF